MDYNIDLKDELGSQVSEPQTQQERYQAFQGVTTYSKNIELVFWS